MNETFELVPNLPNEQEAVQPDTIERFESDIRTDITKLWSEIQDYLRDHPAGDDSLSSRIGTWTKNFDEIRSALSKRGDKLSSASEGDGLIIASFHHDIGNTLATLSGVLYAFRSRPPATWSNFLAITENAVRQSEFERLRAPFNTEPTAVSEVIETIADEAKRREKQVDVEAQEFKRTLVGGQPVEALKQPVSTIQIVSTVEPEIGREKIWDKSHVLTDAMLEIIRNAMKSMKQHTVLSQQTDRDSLITIAIRPDETNDAKVVIDIVDNGPGVERRDGTRAWVFNKGDTTKVLGQGTGKGLHEHRASLRENLGGDITIDEEKEGGTRFSITVPISVPSLHELHTAIA